MAVTSEDLRVHLGYEPDEWSVSDATRADGLIVRALNRVRAFVGGHRIDLAVFEEDQDKLDAVDEATMILAVAMFENPESVMQRRHGPDKSVSFADSSDAAGGRREAREILRGAFGMRAGTTTL